MGTIGFMQVLPPKTPEATALEIIAYINECQKIDATPRTEKIANIIRLAFPRQELPPIQPYYPNSEPIIPPKITKWPRVEGPFWYDSETARKSKADRQHPEGKIGT